MKRRACGPCIATLVVTSLWLAGCSESSVDSSADGASVTSAVQTVAPISAERRRLPGGHTQLHTSLSTLVKQPLVLADRVERPVVRPLQDRPAYQQPDKGQPGNARPDSEKPGEDIFGSQKPGHEKPGNGKPGSEKPDTEGPDSDRDERPPSTPSALFSCAPNAGEHTVPQITSPAVNAPLAAGTTLSWERTGHDLCGEYGTNRRYAIAVCTWPDGLLCNPANGFYRANVSPADLGWDDTTPGSYTLNAEDIDTLLAKSTAAFGSTVYFHIRYNYDLFATQYGEWVSRAYQLADAAAPAQAAPSTAPILNVPAAYGPSGPFTLDWASVERAEFYRVRLVYRRGSPSGSDMGVYNGEAETREVFTTSIHYEVNAPAYTMMLVWGVTACNASGCGPEAIHAAFVQPMVASNPATSFDLIKNAFKAPSCVNCHAVAATNFQPRPQTGYESGSNFGLPPQHLSGAGDCTECHDAGLTPGGSHAVPWQAAPAEMDLRNLSDVELCDMAKDPGSLAENIQDHLLGDPLILWAVAGGELPPGASLPYTDAAFTSLDAWENAVLAWVDGGASCN